MRFALSSSVKALFGRGNLPLGRVMVMVLRGKVERRDFVPRPASKRRRGCDAFAD
jgi:hypothetical protein